MKICFLGGGRYSQPLDATSEKKFRVLKSLAELFVIGFSQNLHPQRFTEHAHFYLLPQLPLPFLRYAEMFILGPVLLLWLIMRHGVQILVAQSPYEGWAAAWAKKFAGWCGRKVVLIVESHGDFSEGLFLHRRIRLPGVHRLLMRQAAHFTLGHADLLRVISQATYRQLEHWMPGKPIFQFATWTDIEPFLLAGAEHQEQKSPTILYAGVLTPLKGVHHLINAFASIAQDFPQACLSLVGREESPQYAAELKEQVKQLGLDHRVQFVGAVPQRELALQMRRAYVSVLPSASEGLGRVVVEAMATGTPVIGSQVGGIPEMIKNGENGFLVPPGDAVALAELLRWMLTHPDKVQEMGPRARAFAERFFSTDGYVKGYQQIFAAAQTILADKGEHAYSAV